MRIVVPSDVTARRGVAERWSGEVWRADVLTTDDEGLRSNRFTYAPGARSNWHVHDGEQALIVVAGRGLLLWEGLETARLLGPGDWVHVRPGVAHWHGAVPDDTFVHLAVTASGPTRWLDAVGDAEYRSSLPGAPA